MSFLSDCADRALSYLPGIPSQSALDRQFQRATTARLYLAEECKWRHVVADLVRAEIGAAGISSLRDALKIRTAQMFPICMCQASFVLELRSERKLLCTLNPRHQRTLGFSKWPLFLGILRDGTVFQRWVETQEISLMPSPEATRRSREEIRHSMDRQLAALERKLKRRTKPTNPPTNSDIE